MPAFKLAAFALLRKSRLAKWAEWRATHRRESFQMRRPERGHCSDLFLRFLVKKKLTQIFITVIEPLDSSG